MVISSVSVVRIVILTRLFFLFIGMIFCQFSCQHYKSVPIQISSIELLHLKFEKDGASTLEIVVGFRGNFGLRDASWEALNAYLQQLNSFFLEKREPVINWVLMLRRQCCGLFFQDLETQFNHMRRVDKGRQRIHDRHKTGRSIVRSPFYCLSSISSDMKLTDRVDGVCFVIVPKGDNIS